MSKFKKKKIAKTARPKLEELKKLQSDLLHGIDGMRPLEQYIPSRSIKTVWPGFDRVSGTWGIPLGTVNLVHGPPAGGKTVLSMALGMISFLQQGHLAYYIDAELAADKDWFAKVGVDLHKAMYKRPTTYEETRKTVSVLLNNTHKALEKGELPPDCAISIVIDSLDKCMPKDLLEKATKTGEVPREAGWDKARANKDFLNTLTPLLDGIPVVIFLITHEAEFDAGYGKFKYKAFRPKGGSEILYEARQQFRVRHAGFETSSDVKIAKKHKLKIVKNKLGFPDTETVFYTATEAGFARGVPTLDLGRTLLDEAVFVGIFQGRSKKKDAPAGTGMSLLPPPVHTTAKSSSGRLLYDGKNLYREQWVSQLNSDDGFYMAIWDQVAEKHDEMRKAEEQDGMDRS